MTAPPEDRVAPPPFDLDGRVANVRQRWAAALPAVATTSRRWREDRSFPRFFRAFIVVIAATLIDFTYWTPSFGRFLHRVAAVEGTTVLVPGVVLFLVNALLLDRSFERRWRARGLGQRILRFLVSGIPSLGIDLVLVWYRAKRRQPLAEPAALQLQDLGQRAPIRGRGRRTGTFRWERTLLGAALEMAGLVALNSLFSLFLLTWHIARQAREPQWPSLLVLYLIHG